MKRPDTLIEVASASKDAGSHSRAMAGFLDNFYTLPDRCQAMIDPKPPLTGRADMDAYLGAPRLANSRRHLAGRAHLKRHKGKEI